ncbi:ABC transporter permease [Candidatus Dojkabacteria bacterium]|nr:ABC transporter permease [Candidatus Dojkabacteria bacterium]
MFSPLSILTYFFKNKRKVIPILAIITLSILGISVTAAINGSMWREITDRVWFYEKYYDVYLTFSSESEGSLEEYQEEVEQVDKEIKELDAVDHIIVADVQATDLMTLFGNEGARVIFVGEDDREKFVNEIGIELDEGRYPESADEIALGREMLMNKDLKVGDSIGSKIDDEESLSGEYKIVGALTYSDSKKSMKLGIGYRENKSDDLSSAGLFLLNPKDGKAEELASALSRLEDKYGVIRVNTKESVDKMIDEEFSAVSKVLWAINVVVTLTITSSIALLNVIFFMQRANEFGLLASLGYSRKFIVGRTLLESLISIILGWGLGIIFSEVVYGILNSWIFTPRGIQGLTVLESQTFLFTIPVPLAVAIFSCGTVFWKLMRMDPVSIIEKRD